ncbi:29853_t:CDS:2 [Gigaspora margarita]|uniref:29853_t:CDS:1 n=1 Tax=Gigaspora margarita TaxID=4874 RepID=A0ABN7UK86_GIGMA|nr:29853_t:CDS:2 [Gigaspora margarita]
MPYCEQMYDASVFNNEESQIEIQAHRFIIRNRLLNKNLPNNNTKNLGKIGSLCAPFSELPL